MVVVCLFCVRVMFIINMLKVKRALLSIVANNDNQYILSASRFIIWLFLSCCPTVHLTCLVVFDQVFL